MRRKCVQMLRNYFGSAAAKMRSAFVFRKSRPSPANVSVEPSIFLFFVAATLLDFGNTNLYLQKACRWNATVEPDLSTPCDDTERAVTFVASVNTYVVPVKMTLVTVCVVAYSSWSDRAGRKRKLFVTMAMVGQLLESGCEWWHSYWWTWHPAYAALTSAMLRIVFGCSATVYTFGYMYLADVVQPQNRTRRLVVFSATSAFGRLVGNGAAGHVLQAVGFRRYYALCLGVAAVALLLACLLVEDISVPVKGSPGSAFSVYNVIESCKIILGRGSPKRRCTVTLLLVVYTVLLFVHHGQNSVIYLYLRYKFHWNEVMYSVFLLYACMSTIFGTFLSSVVLSGTLKIHDAAIGIIAATWDALLAICYIFATENWQLFLISGMDIFYGVSTTVCVSAVTKFYDTTEMGHLFAVKQLFCVLVSVCHPAYSILFEMTLHEMPCAFFFVSFLLYVIGAVFYCIIYSLTREESGNKASPKYAKLLEL